MQRQAGFTLVELMVLVAIVAILAVIAIPNFSATVKGDRDTAQINTLVTGLALARSEAVKSGSNVKICSSSNGDTCTASAWNDGWVIRYVTPPPGMSSLIRTFPALNSGSSLDASASVSSITFNATGMTNLSTTAKFTLCDGRGAHYARALNLLVSGVTQASRTPGRHVDGSALSCPGT